MCNHKISQWLIYIVVGIILTTTHCTGYAPTLQKLSNLSNDSTLNGTFL